MFARWRNLAAAAGVFCFPLSFAYASTQFDGSSPTHSAPCTRSQEANDESSWFRTERDSWYERYYDATLDDAATSDDVPVATSQPQDPSAIQPPAIILDIEAIDEGNDDPTSDDTSNPCDSIHCPCHDILNSEDDEVNNDQALEDTTPITDLESEFFDVYAPYVYPDVTNNESSKSEPNAELTGTIEPIFEDSEAAWFDEWTCGIDRSNQDPEPLLDEIDTISDPANSDTGEFRAVDEADECIDSSDSDNAAPKYHMFYPGCDWSPYYPASNSNEASGPLLPEDVRSS